MAKDAPVHTTLGDSGPIEHRGPSPPTGFRRRNQDDIEGAYSPLLNRSFLFGDAVGNDL